MFDSDSRVSWLSQFEQKGALDAVDFRFSDLPGRWNHVVHVTDGLRLQDKPPIIGVASTSLMGWGSVQSSELGLLPRVDTAFVDPFAKERTLVVTCDLVDPTSKAPDPKDPRATLQRAIMHLGNGNVAEQLQVGTELEFHLFKGVRFAQGAMESFVKIQEVDGSEDNPGHRIAYAQHHYTAGPADWASSFRSTIVTTLKAIGVAPRHHQHEAAPSQHELSLVHSEALPAADNIQKAKYVVLSSAARLGHSATFMPKPVAYRAGSGLHLNMSLWRKERPVFAGSGVAGLSNVGLSFIAGILSHSRALNALLNPTFNSYRRLDGIYNPMVDVFYGTANRTAPIRVPYANSSAEKRLEVRFCDASANPYLAIAGLLMAGLDGIERNLTPGPPLETDATRSLGAFDPRKRAAHSLCRTLEEAIIALDGDRAFLTSGGVFTETLIDAQLAELCRQVRVMRGLPHPNEFAMFYGC